MKSAKFYEIKVDNNTVTCYPSFCDFLCVVYCARVLNIFLVFEPTKKRKGTWRRYSSSSSRLWLSRLLGDSFSFAFSSFSSPSLSFTLEERSSRLFGCCESGVNNGGGGGGAVCEKWAKAESKVKKRSKEKGRPYNTVAKWVCISACWIRDTR